VIFKRKANVRGYMGSVSWFISACRIILLEAKRAFEYHRKTVTTF
jgi:hypothetical protein